MMEGKIKNGNRGRILNQTFYQLNPDPQLPITMAHFEGKKQTITVQSPNN